MKINLTHAWQTLNQNTIGYDSYWHIALQNEVTLQDTVPLIKSFIRGHTLDLGAGKLAWKKILCDFAKTYISADFTKEHPDLDFLFDATKTFPLINGSFDSVFCYSVLEHTPKPWLVLPEIFRILKSQGYAVLSVPFVFYLHGEPHDYFRFTKYGIAKLAQEAGFSVEKIKISGGIFHFLLNMPSVVLSSLLASIHLSILIKPLTITLFKIAQWLDNVFDRNGLFSMNLIVVLKKQ